MSASRQLRAVPDAPLPSLLRQRRHQLNLTQLEAADRIGTSQQLVANWERGSQPSNKYMPGIATFLGFDTVDALQARIHGGLAAEQPNAQDVLARLTNAFAQRVALGEKLSDEEAKLLGKLIDAHLASADK